MEEKIISVWKCRRCKDEIGYIVRGKNINTGVTDKDVWSIVNRNLQNPIRTGQCECCGKFSVLDFIGMDGLL